MKEVVVAGAEVGAIKLEREQGQYGLYGPIKKTSRGDIRQGIACQNVGLGVELSFYWRCLVDLYGNEQGSIAKQVAEFWLRDPGRRSSAQYCAGWLYKAQYLCSRDPRKDQEIYACRPTSEPLDFDLKLLYQLWSGVLACRLQESKEAFRLLTLVAQQGGKKWPWTGLHSMKNMQQTALFHLIQVVYNLKEEKDCFLYLKELELELLINKNFPQLLSQIKELCISSWFKRVVEMVNYGRGARDPALAPKRLLEEGKYWDQHASSEITQIGLGMYYFSEGCIGENRQMREAGLSVAKEYLLPNIDKSQEARMFYQGCSE